jgi:hypothetical protein
MKAPARRVAAVLALTLPAAGLVISTGLPQASACSLSSHCYVQAFNQNNAANHGVYGQLYVTCLYQPYEAIFANNEVWDLDTSGDYWVEAGLKSGQDYHGAYRDKDWFWADNRPVYGYAEHDFSEEANLTTKYPVEITYAGTGTWDVYGGDDLSELGVSATNSFIPNQAQGGTEYTSDAGSGLRDIGAIYNLENEDLHSSWHLLGNAGALSESGSGHFINGNWNSATSELSWSGPC